jgi:hypothetical protein
MIHRLLWALSALLFASAPAAAQRWPDQQCVENPNLEPCLQSRGDSLARVYGVRRIEEHRDAGDEVLRIFYSKDGFNVLVSFVRAASREPIAYVHFPRVDGLPAPAPMQAPIPQASWYQALYRAAYADRSFVPVPPPPSDNQTICLHPWAYVFEASVPAAPATGVRPYVRRYSIYSCDDAPLLHFAADLQRLVLPLFPACDAIDDRLYGNGVQRLLRCRALSGDRLAAAGVLNLVHAFESIGGSADPHDLDNLFASDVTIDWNGRRRPQGDQAPAAFWRARMAEDRVNDFHVEVIEGQSADRVRVTGYLFRDQPGTNDETISRARLEQVWTRTYSGTRVTSVTVGPWEVHRPD